jgi:hypothetical protein
MSVRYLIAFIFFVTYNNFLNLPAMIPSTERKKWRDLVTGSFNIETMSHSLKIKINTVRKKIRTNQLTVEDATEEIYDYCMNHYDLFKNDLFKIFKKVS